MSLRLAGARRVRGRFGAIPLPLAVSSFVAGADSTILLNRPSDVEADALLVVRVESGVIRLRPGPMNSGAGLGVSTADNLQFGTPPGNKTGDGPYRVTAAMGIPVNQEFFIRRVGANFELHVDRATALVGSIGRFDLQAPNGALNVGLPTDEGSVVGWAHAAVANQSNDRYGSVRVSAGETVRVPSPATMSVRAFAGAVFSASWA